MRNAGCAESRKSGMPEEPQKCRTPKERRKNSGRMLEERRAESEDGEEKSNKREGCREIWKL